MTECANGCQHHAKEDVASVVSQGMQRMKEAGFKMTKKREEILTYFATHNRYMSAKEIFEVMTEKYPTMSYNTTYRNIYDFVDIGVLEKTEYDNEQMFRLNCYQDHHHHHFICKKCGVAIPIDACPMDHIQTDLSRVKIESHRFEIFGLCECCLNDKH